MKQMKWLLSSIAVLALLAGCSGQSAKSGTEEKKKTADASAATEQAKTEETKTEETTGAAPAPAQTSVQATQPAASGENVPAASAPAADSNKGASPNTASSTNKTQVSDSKQAAAAAQQAPAVTAPAAQTPSPAPAPAQPASTPVQEQKQETVAVTLSIRDNQKTILSSTSVDLQAGDTVFTVLARTVKKKGIQMEYTGSGASVYVQGINNLYEMDRGPKSGWRYYVNGVLANKSAGVFNLNKGDKVQWQYTDDYTKGGQ